MPPNQDLYPVCNVGFFCAEPCKGVSCSAHAFCRAEPSASEAFCVCEEGWTYDPANPAAGCVDVDECRVTGTCGENTLCTNTPGNYVCQCRPGYTGNPQVRCIGECSFFTVLRPIYWLRLRVSLFCLAAAPASATDL